MLSRHCDLRLSGCDETTRYGDESLPMRGEPVRKAGLPVQVPKAPVAIVAPTIPARDVAVIRSSLSLVALLARRHDGFGRRTARHRSRRHQPQRRRLHRLLRLRQRRVAAAEPDPRLHGPLEPPLAIRRGQQGTRARHPRRAVGENRLAQGQRRAARRRLLRRLHGRIAGSTRSAASRSSRWLAEIDAIKDQRRRAAHDRQAARRGRRRAVRRLRRRRPARTRPGPSRTSTPAAWACPTATTTSRPSRASSRRARSTSSTWRRCSSSPAPSRTQAQAERRRPCSRSRSAWPRPRSTTSQLRDPKLQDHTTAFADLPQARAAASTGTRTSTPPTCRTIALNVTQPKFLQQVDKELATTPLAAVEDLPAVARPQRRRRTRCPRPSSRRTSPSTASYLTGATEMKPRWKRCAETTDNQLGEALGQKYVEKYFPPEAKARMQEMVKNILLAMDDTIRGLDWMDADDQEEGAGEARDLLSPRSAIRTSGRTTRACVVTRDSYWDNVVAASRWNVADNRTPGRQAGRSQPLGHDAADVERVLQPAAERDRVPGRHPAAARVRRERHRRRQLRRDRRRHRPRDQPRLRRPGRAVRRAGPPGQLVDARGPQAVPGQAASAWSTSSRATSSSRASTTTASWCWANRSATSPAPSSPTAPTRSRAKARARSRPSTASRPSSSSSSPGASGAATRPARRPSAR